MMTIGGGGIARFQKLSLFGLRVARIVHTVKIFTSAYQALVAGYFYELRGEVTYTDTGSAAFAYGWHWSGGQEVMIIVLELTRFGLVKLRLAFRRYPEFATRDWIVTEVSQKCGNENCTETCLDRR